MNQSRCRGLKLLVMSALLLFSRTTKPFQCDLNGLADQVNDIVQLIPNINFNIEVILQRLCDVPVCSSIAILSSEIDLLRTNSLCCDFTSIFDAISESQAIISSQIDHLPFGATAIDVQCDIASVLDAISISQALLSSQIDRISASICCDLTPIITEISLSEATILSAIDQITGSFCCDLDPVLSAISLLSSQIENINASVCCDLTPIVSEISVSESTILSAIDRINASICCDLTPIITEVSLSEATILSAIDQITGSFCCDLDPVLSAISLLSSQIENINASVCCDLTPIVNEISVSESTILSAIDRISASVCCDLTPIITEVSLSEATILSAIDQITGSFCCNFDPILVAISESEATILSALDRIGVSSLDAPCARTPITTPTTITLEGSYCVDNMIPSPGITVSASNVSIDLNGYRVVNVDITSGVTNVDIGGGFIDGASDGLRAINATNLFLYDIIIRNATTSGGAVGAGINFTGVSNARVQNIQLIDNVIGFYLNDSHKISIDRVIADGNREFGFELINSTTCCIRDSKALSTGRNSTGAESAIVGFDSRGGYGNVFENCISNGTQGLLTTQYYDHLVAGFALRYDDAQQPQAEQASKIINCEAANATTNPAGQTVPYGILIEGLFTVLNPDTTPGSAEFLITLTADPVIPESTGNVLAVSWRLDQQYFAIIHNVVASRVCDVSPVGLVDVYAFDNNKRIASKVDTACLSTEVTDVAWSPDGTFIATSGFGSNAVAVSQFCSVTNKLKLVATPVPADLPPNEGQSVAWSPDGNFIVIGTDSNASNAAETIVYYFDRAAQTLKRVTSIAVNEMLPLGDQVVNDVEFSPDGRYIAAVLEVTVPPARLLQVYAFNQNLSLSLSSFQLASGPIRAVSWSPDGKFIAIGSGTDLQIHPFSSGGIVGMEVGEAQADNQILGVDWSDDGQYVVLCTATDNYLNEDFVQVYKFDRSDTNFMTSLSLIAVPDIQPDAYNENVNAVEWSPDGRFILVGTDDLNLRVGIYQALEFGEGNVVNNNTVYCNSGNQYPGGIGISGSSIQNIILYNTSYSNPLKPFMVNQNYAFVTNVFNDLFGVGPTQLQNISIDYNRGIRQPEDPILLLKQIKNMINGLSACDAASSVQCDLAPILIAVSQSEANILSAIDLINLSRLPDIFATFIVGPISITAECDLTSVLEAISVSETTILSAIDQIPFGATAIDINCNNDFTSVLDAISVSEARLSSQIDRLSGNSLCCDFTSILDAISESQAVILSAIDTILTNTRSCAAIPIFQEDIPTTITQSGVYCLAEDVSYAGAISADIPIVVAVNNVTIDLNNHVLTASGLSSSAILIVSLDNTTIQNGTVVGAASTSGIAVSSSRNTVIKNVAVENTGTIGDSVFTQAGIGLVSAEDALIEHCLLTRNNVGIFLVGGQNVIIENTNAISSGAAGFVLASNATHVKDCQAIRTGEGNTGIVNELAIGFYLLGNTNILECCIANATMLSSATDQASVVAGILVAGSCNKVIDCEAANATVAGNGVTIPYGILLQSLDGLVSVTGINPGMGGGDLIGALDWSLDGKYLAVGNSLGANNDSLYVYKFDYVKEELVQVDSAGFTGLYGGSVESVEWSPDGQYLAVGTGLNGNTEGELHLYRFDRENEQLTLLQSINYGVSVTTIVNTIAWSPDSRYLAVGGADLSGENLRLYRFDRIAQSLSQVYATNPRAATDQVLDIAWAPDGNYLAVGLDTNTGDELFVYRFDRASQTLVLFTSLNPGGAPTDSVFAVAWSPDGKYLAIGGTIDIAAGADFIIYSFDPTNVIVPLVPVASTSPGGSGSDSVRSIAWSPDGKYVAMGLDLTTPGDDLFVYRFDRGSLSLILENSDNPDAGSDNDFIGAIAWSPDGQYLAVGGLIYGNSGNDLFIYKVLAFAFQNVITGNVVYCNSGGVGPQGVGISGSSIANYIVGNTAYSNPCPPTGGVGSNYEFVTNVFNQMFGQAPSGLQNIGIKCNEPICPPEDLALLIKQTQFLLSSQIENISTSICCDLNPIINAISISQASLSSQIDLINASASCNLDPVLNAVSQSQAILSSQIDQIPFGATAIDINCNNDFTSVLDAISRSEAILSSQIDQIPFGATAIDINCNNDFTSVLDAISISQALLSSQIDQISASICCDLTPIITEISLSESILLSAIDRISASLCCNLDPVINAISIAEANLSSQIELINASASCNLQPVLDAVSISEARLSSQIDLINLSACCDFTTILDAISQSQATLLSAIDAISFPDSLCAAIPITAPTTITVSGFYCVANEISSAGTIIEIQADDVVIDLNNHTIESTGTSAIVSDASRVTIKDGRVIAANQGVFLNGASQFLIQHVAFENSLQPIGIANSSYVVIEDCVINNGLFGIGSTSSSNITIRNVVMENPGDKGIEFTDVQVATFENVKVIGSTTHGFDFISSSSCVLRECQAINVGRGSDGTELVIAAFNSENCHGNIFEGCVANGTQALETVLISTPVAGFRLDTDSRCCKIINCEAANATVNATGFTVPYGILLDATVNNTMTLTAAPQMPLQEVFDISWRGDEKYIAATGHFDVYVYQFDIKNKVMARVAVSDVSTIGFITDIAWSPDGKYIAISNLTLNPANDAHDVRIYEFCSLNNTLKLVAQASQSNSSAAGIFAIAWSPNGQYLATGDTDSFLGVLKFDRVSLQLSNAITPIDLNQSAINSIHWNPNGQLLAVGATQATTGRLLVCGVNLATQTLTVIDTASDADPVQSVKWSPNGKYIAIASFPAGATISVFKYDYATASLQSSPATVAIGASSVDWSANGRYVTALVNIGTDTVPIAQVHIYDYNPAGTGSLFGPISTANIAPSDFPGEVAWSPSGGFIAASGDQLNTYQALDFPSQNVITGNVVYCNSGGMCPQGVGISGSSIANYIVGNTAYSNPCPPVQGVGSNYEFVTNVYNQMFGQGPTGLQNISIGCNEQICLQEDLALLIKQTKFILGSKIDLLLTSTISCAPITISSPTTITAEGSYCVRTMIGAPGIVVDADNVTIDLSGRRVVTMDILPGHTNVEVFGGFIDGGSNGITATNATNLFIHDLTIRNAVLDMSSVGAGISFTGVANSRVQDVKLVQNVIGMYLENSHKITIDNVVADQNTQFGFELISSSTNCLRDCKAFATGEGNNDVTDNDVVGFASSNGYGNIFERCIANSTQAISTTDFDSIVAGFALRGTEACSKIIDCEAANATVADNGFTVPYGILLEKQLIQGGSTVAAGYFNNDITPVDIVWSPDGNFFATCSSKSGAFKKLLVFEFDRVRSRIRERASLFLGNSTQVWSLDWSPSQNFIAITEVITNKMSVYQFEPINNTLNFIASSNVVFGTPPAAISSNEIESPDVAWRFDGSFLAIADDISNVFVYTFDQIALSLDHSATFSGIAKPVSLSWSPDGDLLAVAARDQGVIQVYEFDMVYGTLDQIATSTISTTDLVVPVALEWSPNGKYIAVAGNEPVGQPLPTADDNLYVFEFHRDTVSLEFINKAPFSERPIKTRKVVWSPDSTYIATAGNPSGFVFGNAIPVYTFDPSQRTVQLAATFSKDNPLSVDWSPDGEYLVVGDETNTAPGKIVTYKVLNFPSQNVVKNNVVYCNSGGMCPQGVGISGSSIANYIVGNTAYSNPCPPFAGIGSNYIFAANVFNQLFGNEPSDLQNISLGCNVPINTPDDCALLIKQAQFILNSKIDLLLTGTVSCAPTPIFASDIPTTITQSGVYCLAEDVTSNGAIKINASDVTIDLNNHVISLVSNPLNSAIVGVPNLDRIVIKNGKIVLMGDGVGISFFVVRQLVIDDVEIEIQGNGTGVSLTVVNQFVINDSAVIGGLSGFNIVTSFDGSIKNSTATGCKTSGFNLLMSSTCLVKDCNAFNIGETYTQENALNGIVAFNVQGGSGNIFERCIANVTQGLTVTGSSSLVAGFRLGSIFEDDAFNIPQCNKIIDCEAANATVGDNSFTIPYGILLQATLTNPITLTAVPPIPVPSAGVDTLSWSGDEKFLAVGFGNTLAVYQFDHNSFILSRVAAASVGLVTSVEWSPDGMYLAVGLEISGSTGVAIYEFCRKSNQLILFATPNIIPSENVNSVSWSTNGQFVAVGVGPLNNTSGNLVVYQLNKVTKSLTQIATATGQIGNMVATVDWHPSDRFIAIGTSTAPLAANMIRIFEFNQNNSMLVQVALPQAGQEPIAGGNINEVSWSFDGRYLAVAEEVSPPPGLVLVYGFNSDAPQLDLKDSLITDSPDSIPTSLDWSPDGTYIAVGKWDDVSSFQLEILEFDRGSSDLFIQINSAVFTDTPTQVRWSPAGEYVALGTDTYPVSNQPLMIFNVLTFPSQNVIKNNVVYCNSGGVGPQGVGISGSSIANYIVGNTAYSNPCPPTGSVGSNYQFVTNIFNQLFGNEPSGLQNISIRCNEPIAMQEDLALLIKQAQFILGSKIDLLLTGTVSCAPTPIFASDIPTTITQAGVYCLAEDVSLVGGNAISIGVNNVTIDLNDHVITAATGIVSTGYNNIVIQNGTVDCTFAGLDINNGSNVLIENVTASHGAALAGINFDNVTNGIIKSCLLTHNNAGVLLTGCAKIVVQDTIADGNQNKGFSLISSNTCCVRDCKALATGENNPIIDTNNFGGIVGFDSLSGYGNIFERCIANATQGLSVTGFSSVVAGFRLGAVVDEFLVGATNQEQCTKIIDCEASNATVSPIGVTVPYGILLQARFDGLVSVTAVNPDGGATDDIIASIAWTSDGKYLAIGGTINGATGNDLFVYKFDYVNQSLTQIISLSPGGASDSVSAVAWSPDNKYLVIGGALTGNTLRLYSFDRDNETLSQVQSLNPNNDDSDDILTVSWSLDGRYLAVGGFTLSGGNLYVYNFDRVAQALTQTYSLSVGGVGFNTVNSVAWSPDGKYLAVGGDFISSNELYAYSFDRGSQTLVEIAAINPGGAVNSVAWSPDGQYLAIGAVTTEFSVYSFDANISMPLIEVASKTLAGGGSNLYGVTWSPNGMYLAVVGTFASSDSVQIYTFDRGSNELLLEGSNNPDMGAGGDVIRSVAWSPDGQYLVVGGGITGNTNFDLFIYQALTFPSQNVIKNNVVYCNSGGVGPQGVGISGSSIANYIVGNTAYSNPCPPTGGVGSNYQFVTNVFNQMFGQEPTGLQNIGIRCNEPICPPEDVALLVKQLSAKVGCGATAITGPTTITQEGVYCIAKPINGDIVVVTDNVTLIGNGYGTIVNGTVDVPGGMNVSGSGTIGNVTIRDIVSSGGSPAIQVSNVTNLIIQNVVGQTGDAGIILTNVSRGTIANCDLIQNSTAISLSSCNNVIVDGVTGKQNTHMGVSLMNSRNCTVQNTQMIETGSGNFDQANTQVFGFMAMNGSNNIFDRCIANATQALSTTDFNSMVAGFALRGTENNTVMTNNQANDTHVGNNTTTIPYGFLLEPRIDTLTTVTGWGFGNSVDITQGVDWSPDGRFLVSASTLEANEFEVNLFRFDRASNTLVLVDSKDPDLHLGATSGGNAQVAKFSPSGSYVAVGGKFENKDFLLYQFVESQNALTEVLGVPVINGVVNDVAWSPDELFVTAGGSNGTIVYSFNRNLAALQLVSTVTDSAQTIAWSPTRDTNDIVALGGGFGSPGLVTYEFNRSTDTLDNKKIYVSSDNIVATAWSPDGKLLATAGSGSSNDILIWQLDNNNNLTLLIGNAGPTGGVVRTLDWSSDSRFLVVSGSTDLIVYKVDRSTPTLVEQARDTSFLNTQFDVKWSPDGLYIAVGSNALIPSPNESLFIVRGLQFPNNNNLQQNSATSRAAVGFSATSGCNQIIGNSTFSRESNTNYAYVTTVFSQLRGEAPTAQQNIARTDSQLIPLSFNTPLILQKTQNMVSVGPDPLTPIVAGSVVGPQQSIVSQFCNPNDQIMIIDRSGDFAPVDATESLAYVFILADKVRFNQNNKRIANGIIVRPSSGVNMLNDVIIENGIFSGASPAIDAANVNNLQLRNVIARDGDQGIVLNNVQYGLIQNCDMRSNDTGIQIINSANVVVENSRAVDSYSVGFELVNSTTCCFVDCKALSTGGRNTMEDNVLIAGFLTTDGYANIFERCIANSTQALSTTDFDSTVGGFVLRGTETASKIIKSESANTQTKLGGLTIPYGILLQSSISSPLTLTAVPPIGGLGAAGTAIDWSADGRYLAAASSTEVALFSYDAYRNILSRVTDVALAGTIDAISWSPDGTFLAIGTDSGIISIYEFDSRNQVLNFKVASTPGALPDINAIVWSADGRYLATANATGAPGELNVIKYNTSSNVLTLEASASVASAANSVAWSADNTFLATGHADGIMRIFSFANNALSSPITATTSGVVNNVAWSPDSTFLAVGTAASIVELYGFDRTTLTLSLIGMSANLGTAVNGVEFSSDGRRISAGLSDGTIRVFNANPLTPLMQQATSVAAGAALTNISWGPDGSVIAATVANSNGFVIYKALVFPIANVIIDNIVYANTGDLGNRGIGISGSSISNAIVQNISYANPQDPLGNATNYAFVTNIFNQLFGQAPTQLQNISIAAPDALARPIDIGMIAQQIKFQVNVIQSEIENINFSTTCNFDPVLNAISQSQAILSSQIDEISASICCDLSPIITEISLSEATLLSAIDRISGSFTCNLDPVLDAISISEARLSSQIDLINASASCDLDPVLNAISQSQAILSSQIDQIPFGATAIDINCNANVDFTSVLDAISISEARLSSQIDLINASASCDLDPVLNAISQSQAILSSQIDEIPFGATAIDINCNANVDFTSVLDAISISEARLSSQIDLIQLSACCDFSTILDAISQSQAILSSQIDQIPFGATAIDINCNAAVDFTSVLDAISLSEAELASQLDVIESKIDDISCGGATQIDINISAIQDIQPILNAISLSEAELASQLDVIESKIDDISCGGATAIDINITTDINIIISAIQDIQPILNAISLSEAELSSQLDVIESKIDDISCGGATSIDINISAIQDIQPILNAISQSQTVLSSQLDNVQNVLGQKSDIGTCLDDMIANMPMDINNFQLNVIQLLKTILLELRGCCAT